MPETSCIDFSKIQRESNPFSHFYLTSVLREHLDKELFEWLEQTDAWQSVETDFYEQYEFSLQSVALPARLSCLVAEKTIRETRQTMQEIFLVEKLDLVGIVAHKLVEGQHIGIHNDFIEGEETHRLVIQINPHWTESNGGYLMLFNSQDVEDVSKVISPINNTAFGFEISKDSHHAVSKIYGLPRYSIVYTFRLRDK